MILVTFVMTVSAPVLAHADEDDWSITRYDLTATAAQDGTTRVTIDFDSTSTSPARRVTGPT